MSTLDSVAQFLYSGSGGNTGVLSSFSLVRRALQGVCSKSYQQAASLRPRIPSRPSCTSLPHPPALWAAAGILALVPGRTLQRTCFCFSLPAGLDLPSAQARPIATCPTGRVTRRGPRKGGEEEVRVPITPLEWKIDEG